MQLGSDAMHADVVRTYIDASVRLLAPIAPHWADHVFRNVLKSGETVLTAGWPQLPPADLRLKMAGEYVEKLIAKLRAALDKKEAPPRGKPPCQGCIPHCTRLLFVQSRILQTGPTNRRLSG